MLLWYIKTRNPTVTLIVNNVSGVHTYTYVYIPDSIESLTFANAPCCSRLFAWYNGTEMDETSTQVASVYLPTNAPHPLLLRFSYRSVHLLPWLMCLVFGMWSRKPVQFTLIAVGHVGISSSTDNCENCSRIQQHFSPTRRVVHTGVCTSQSNKSCGYFDIQ